MERDKEKIFINNKDEKKTAAGDFEPLGKIRILKPSDKLALLKFKKPGAEAKIIPFKKKMVKV